MSPGIRWLKDIALAVILFGTIWVVGYFIETNIMPYEVRVIISCGIAITLALSLNLISGIAGQFSLGHAGFMAVGAYVSATLTTVYRIPFFSQSVLGFQVAILIGGLAAAVAGYLVGLPSLRLRGDYLAIVTLGFGEIIRICFSNIELVGGALGITGIPILVNFFWVYAWAALTFIAMYRLIYSSYGRAILSVREDEIAAESMGINVARYKVIAFVVSSFFAGVGGALFAHYNYAVNPQIFSFARSVDFVIMVVIGGMGSLSGSIIGAFIVCVVPELLRTFEQYRLVIFPLLLVLMMLLRPMGIFGHREIWELGFLKNLKKKRLGGVPVSTRQAKASEIFSLEEAGGTARKRIEYT